MNTQNRFFLSRAGADANIALAVANILENEGYQTFIQDYDIKNRNFLSAMHDALSGSVQVLAFLSPAYLASPYCQLEWTTALASDPLNDRGRLIIFRVADCAPPGILGAFAWRELAAAVDKPDLLKAVVLDAISTDRQGANRPRPVASCYHSARPVLHRELQRHVAFYGRDLELDRLEQALACANANAPGECAPPIILAGLPGIGKSALARAFARGRASSFAGVWWLRAETSATVATGLIELGDTLMPGLRSLSDPKDAARTALDLIGRPRSGPPWLLIYDNLDDPDVLADWHPGLGARVIATSRYSAWGGDVELMDLRAMAPDAAQAFLVTATARGARLTPGDATTIAKALGGLPLALSHAAAAFVRNRALTARSYLQRIDTHLSAAPAGAEYPRAVYATLNEALERAEAEAPGAAAALSVVAYLGAEAIPLDLFAASAEFFPAEARALAESEGAREEALGALDRHGLIVLDPVAGRFDTHRLVQAAMRDQLAAKGPNYAMAALQRVYMAIPVSNATSGIEPVSTWPIFKAWLTHGLSVLDHAPMDGDGRLGGAVVAVQFGMYLRSIGDYRGAEALFKRTIQFSEKLNRAHRLRAMMALAALYIDADRLDQAQALQLEVTSLAEALKDVEPDLYGDALSMRGMILFKGGQNAKAREPLTTALEHCVSYHGPSSPWTALAHNNLALAELGCDRLTAAREHFEAALACEGGPRPGEASSEHLPTAVTLSNLSLVLMLLGQLSQAEERVRLAIEIWEQSVGQTHPQTRFGYNSLGAILQARGRHAEAIELFRRALQLCETSGATPGSAALIKLNLACSLKDISEQQLALGLAREAAVDCTSEFGPQSLQTSQAEAILGNLLSETGKDGEAEIMLRRALTTMAVRPSSANIRLVAVMALADVLNRRGAKDEALDLVEKALIATRRSFGHHSQWTGVLANKVADFAEERGDLVRAESLYADALAALSASLGPNRAETANQHQALGRVLTLRGELALAQIHLNEALRIHTVRHGRDHWSVGYDLRLLSRLHAKAGHPQESLQSARRSLAITRMHRADDDPRLLRGLETLHTAAQLADDVADTEQMLDEIARFHACKSQVSANKLSSTNSSITALDKAGLAVAFFQRALSGARSDQLATSLSKGALEAKLAEAHEAAGQRGEAVAALERALALLLADAAVPPTYSTLIHERLNSLQAQSVDD